MVLRSRRGPPDPVHPCTPPRGPPTRPDPTRRPSCEYVVVGTAGVSLLPPRVRSDPCPTSRPVRLTTPPRTLPQKACLQDLRSSAHPALCASHPADATESAHSTRGSGPRPRPLYVPGLVHPAPPASSTLNPRTPSTLSRRPRPLWVRDGPVVTPRLRASHVFHTSHPRRESCVPPCAPSEAVSLPTPRSPNTRLGGDWFLLCTKLCCETSTFSNVTGDILSCGRLRSN